MVGEEEAECAPLLEGGARRPRLAALIVSCVAALAALALVIFVSLPSSREGLAVELSLKLQRGASAEGEVADSDAAAFGAVKSGANWDQGWLKGFVRGGADSDQRPRRGRAEQRRSRGQAGDKVDQIHSLLNKAVSMMADLDHQKGDSSRRAPRTRLPESGSPAMNRESQARLAKYEAFKRQAELPQCFKVNDFSDADRTKALQRMSDAADNLQLSYPGWAKGFSIAGKGQDGEWRSDRGPPYAQRITMFAGAGVDTLGNGNLVRRALGLNTAFQKACDLRSCDHAMAGNQYIKTFDGAQFRFLYRAACSTIVIPPLTKGAGPVLGDNGLYRLHHFMKDGFNTMVVCGSTSSVLFMNQNVATIDGGFNLEPSWVEGPYEAQAAQGANTPFAALAPTLPGPGTGVTGVLVSSLPANAISYYEAEDVSVVFEIPMGQGRLIYLGYDYAEPLTPWVHALTAATMFNDYDFKGPPPRTTTASVNRQATQ